MKVTAKKPCVSGEYKVVEETERFYIVYGDTIGGYTALPKCDYEPVQEWVDVTHEASQSWSGASCSTFTTEHISHSGTRLCDIYHQKGYRVSVKIEKVKR